MKEELEGMPSREPEIVFHQSDASTWANGIQEYRVEKNDFGQEIVTAYPHTPNGFYRIGPMDSGDFYFYAHSEDEQ